MDPRQWFIENEDKWENVGDHIEFFIPESEIPPEVLHSAEMYKERCIRSHKRTQIIQSMGLSDDFE